MSNVPEYTPMEKFICIRCNKEVDEDDINGLSELCPKCEIGDVLTI